MIIITGGKGFIGQHFGNYLKEKNVEYRLLDLPAFDITSIKDRNWMWNNYKPDKVLHLAAISNVTTASKNFLNTIRVNLGATINFFDEANEKKIPFFFMSSASASSVLNIYSATKLCGEIIAQAYYLERQSPITIIRTASVYGNNDPQNRVISQWIKSVNEEKPIIIEGGSQIRCWTYIKDLCQGLDIVLEKGSAGMTYSITGEKEYTLRETAGIIKKFKPNTEIIVLPERKNDGNRKLLDTAASQKIGYTPAYNFEKGIQDMTGWTLCK